MVESPRSEIPTLPSLGPHTSIMAGGFADIPVSFSLLVKGTRPILCSPSLLVATRGFEVEVTLVVTANEPARIPDTAHTAEIEDMGSLGVSSVRMASQPLVVGGAPLTLQPSVITLPAKARP